MSYNRKNIIDGLPTSYDHNYILKTSKKCFLCQKKISVGDLETNAILCTEEFEFIHKECVKKNNFDVIYANPKDITSMIKLKKNHVISDSPENTKPVFYGGML